MKISFLKKIMRLNNILLLVFFVTLSSCDYEFELPEENSIADLTAPAANFSYASTSGDDDAWKTIVFSNLSTSAIDYAWDFGGGNTSTDKDPSYTFEDGEGTYAVTLTASDANGLTGTVTLDVIVAEGPFQPIIVEPGFEDFMLDGGTGDGRDSWRNNDLGGVIQITGSPVTFGEQGAKLPTPAGDRIGYQEIVVEADQNYDLSFWYTMLSGSSDARLIVSVLGVSDNGGTFTSTEDVASNTLASVTQEQYHLQ